MGRHVSILLLAAMLVACGGQPAAQSTAVPTSAPAATEPTAAPTSAPATDAPTETTSSEPTTAAAEPTAASAAVTSCKEGQRLFSHEMLASDPVCIPENPQRIVVLDIASLEMALLLGKKPVLTSEWMLQEMPLLLPEYADTLSTIEGVGYPAELEKVALAQPDLILAPSDTIDVKLASEIAPVVQPKQETYADWKLGTEFWSDVLNAHDFYDKMKANYDQRITELKTALGKPEDIKVSVISSSSYGVSLWMPDSPPGAILSDVGLSRPESQSLVGEESMTRYGEKQYISVSEEKLDLADGDAVFYFTYAATDAETAKKESEAIKAFEQKPLWKQLKAVQAGKAFFVPGYWWRSQSYLLANKVVDDLFTNLANSKASTPVLTGP